MKTRIGAAIAAQLETQGKHEDEDADDGQRHESQTGQQLDDDQSRGQRTEREENCTAEWAGLRFHESVLVLD